MTPLVALVNKRPGDNWRNDLHHIRLTLLEIMAEGGNSWYMIMKAHRALCRAEFKAKQLIKESELHAQYDGENCEADTVSMEEVITHEQGEQDDVDDRSDT